MKRVLIILTLLFFTAMLCLTLFARQIHNGTLPRVRAERLPYELFPYEYVDENGEAEIGSRQQLAIPQTLYDSGQIYIVYSAEKNSEKRNFVKLVNVMIGAEKNGLYEIISGVTAADMVVVSVEGSLVDGCEVYIE